MKKERHQSFLSATRGHGRKADIWKSRREPSPSTESVDTLSPHQDFPASRTVRNKCMWFKSPSQWYCVIAVQAKTNNNSKFIRITYTIWETFSLWLHRPSYYWFEPLHFIDYGKLSILSQVFFFSKFYDHLSSWPFCLLYLHTISVMLFLVLEMQLSISTWIKYL